MRVIERGKEFPVRPIFGGNWNNGAKCGSRSSNWNNSPLNCNSNYSSRRVTDTGAKSNSLADSLSLFERLNSAKAKYATTGRQGLVVDKRKPVTALL